MLCGNHVINCTATILEKTQEESGGAPSTIAAVYAIVEVPSAAVTYTNTHFFSEKEELGFSRGVKRQKQVPGY